MRRALLILACLGSLFAASADAQSARELTREALREFERGNFEEARALFLRAHALEPSARLQRGAGMAAFEVRDYVQAHRLLQQALESDERPLTEAQRVETETLLARTQAFLGRFRFEIAPTDAEIRIDLRPPDREPDGSVVLAVGSHALVVEASGYRPRERRLEVRGGEDETLVVRLEPILADDEPAGTGRTMDTLGWSLVGGGGGFLLLAGIGTGGWAHVGSELGTCRDFEAAGGHCVNETNLAARRRALATFTLVAGAAGLVGVTMGMLRWWWTEKSDGEASAACIPGLLAVDCRWRF